MLGSLWVKTCSKQESARNVEYLMNMKFSEVKKFHFNGFPKMINRLLRHRVKCIHMKWVQTYLEKCCPEYFVSNGCLHSLNILLPQMIYWCLDHILGCGMVMCVVQVWVYQAKLCDGLTSPVRTSYRCTVWGYSACLHAQFMLVILQPSDIGLLDCFLTLLLHRSVSEPKKNC